MSSEQILVDSKTLSIQLSSDGFSFCVYNQTQDIYEVFEKKNFEYTIDNPVELLEQLKVVFKENEILHVKYQEINLIHHNNINTFVPSVLFDEKHQKDYLNYSVKIFDHDYFTHDKIEDQQIHNVYVPFVNINNYIFENFGTFNYQHSSTVFYKNIIKHFSNHQKEMFVNVYLNNYQLFVIENHKLLLYNNFSFHNREDFVYYILFVAEQLNMDPNEFPLYLFGQIEAEDENYQMLYDFVRHVSFYHENNIKWSSKINSKPHQNFNILQLF